MTTESSVNVVVSEGVVEKKRKLNDGVAVPTTPPSSNLLIKRLSDKAKLPTRGSAYAAGYDLYRCAHFPSFILQFEFVLIGIQCRKENRPH